MRPLLFLLATILLTIGVAVPASAVPATVGVSTLDGVVLTAVPADVGTLVSDVRATIDDVGTVARVWESGPGADGRYRVDLTVTVLRGPPLTDPQALHHFLAHYLGRHDAAWARTSYAHLDGPGFRDDHRAFWLVRPGMAIMVRLDPETATAARLVATADGVRVPAAGRVHPLDPSTRGGVAARGMLRPGW